MGTLSGKGPTWQIERLRDERSRDSKGHIFVSTFRVPLMQPTESTLTGVRRTAREQYVKVLLGIVPVGSAYST